MEELKKLLEDSINDGLQGMILSNSTDKERGMKVKLRPVLMKNTLSFQRTLYKGTQVFHQNYDAADCVKQILLDMELFKQAEIHTDKFRATILISKKGKITIKKKMNTGDGGTQNCDGAKTENARCEIPSHNRTKRYILKEGEPVDFLVGLGVQTADGMVVKSKYHKFKQINRYLEFIEDIVKKLPQEGPVRIIDFGCGKSYLTFAMYYYLHTLKGYEVEITGLDLKEDVIALCNKLARQYGYDHLHFEKGDISHYEGADAVDMVVTLHACDTATDYAIEKAVKWGASVILAVPCCQHELNNQISCRELSPILRYGVIKERMAALITDALRAELLEEAGYETQILEFIDMEHTPKNLLIRAVKKEGMRKKKENLQIVTEFLHVDPTLRNLLQ